MTNLNVGILTMGPSVARGLKVLSPSPHFLVSYAKWRLGAEDIPVPNFEPVTFESGLTGQEIFERVLSKNYDVVAFSIYIWNCQELIEAARLIKAARPETIIVFGGPQVSPVAEDIIAEYDFIDILPYVTIPGETIFFHIIKEIIQERKYENVPNIFFRKDDVIVKTEEKIEKIDIETIPSPYLDGTIQLDDENTDLMVVIESSRGCPFACAYCFWGSGSKLMTYYPTDRTIEEIRTVYSHPSVKQVQFADSDFLIKPDRANDILDAIIEYGGDRVVSGFEIDANGLRESKKSAIEKLGKLPEHKITFAVQTTTPAAHELMGKRAKSEKFLENADMIRKWVPDIQIYTDVMLPLPGDNLAGFRNTVDFVFSLRPVHFNLNYPLYLLPGTEYFDKRDELGLIYTEPPYYNVMATKEFPLEDVAIALKIGTWSELFTYYLPGIADFFYTISEIDTDTRRIDRLEEWMNAVESKMRLFPEQADLIEQVTESVKKLNIIKGGMLRTACMPRGVAAIYEAVIKAECKKFPEMTSALQKDRELFVQLCNDEGGSANGDPYEQFKNKDPQALKLSDAGVDVSRFLPRFHF